MQNGTIGHRGNDVFVSRQNLVPQGNTSPVVRRLSPRAVVCPPASPFSLSTFDASLTPGVHSRHHHRPDRACTPLAARRRNADRRSHDIGDALVGRYRRLCAGNAKMPKRQNAITPKTFRVLVVSVSVRGLRRFCGSDVRSCDVSSPPAPPPLSRVGCGRLVMFGNVCVMRGYVEYEVFSVEIEIAEFAMLPRVLRIGRF